MTVVHDDNVEITGTLDVAGAVTFDSTLDVAGADVTLEDGTGDSPKLILKTDYRTHEIWAESVGSPSYADPMVFKAGWASGANNKMFVWRDYVDADLMYLWSDGDLRVTGALRADDEVYFDDVLKVAGNVGIGGYDPTEMLHLRSVGSGTTVLYLHNESTGFSGGPEIRLYKHRLDGAGDTDVCGYLWFEADNDAGTPEQIGYACISGQVIDCSDGTEDGRINFAVRDNGSMEQRASIRPAGLYLDSTFDSGNSPSLFFITSDSEAFEMFAEQAELTSDRLVIKSAHNDGVILDIRDSSDNAEFTFYADGKLTMAGSILMLPDGAWIGAGASDPRIEFDDTNDVVTVEDANFLVAGYLGIGTGSPDRGLVVSGSDASAGTIEVRRSQDVAYGPYLMLTHYRGSAGQDDDYCGIVRWYTYNDAMTPEKIGFADLYVRADDVSDGSEDGSMYFSVMKAGTLTDMFKVRHNAIWMNMPTHDISIEDAINSGTVSSGAGYITLHVGGSERYIPLYSSHS